MSDETKNKNDKDKPSNGETADGNVGDQSATSSRAMTKEKEPWAGFTKIQSLIVGTTLEKVAVLVFFISAVGILVVIFLSLNDSTIENYEALRSADILLVLAATALVVAVIAKIETPVIKSSRFFIHWCSHNSNK